MKKLIYLSVLVLAPVLIMQSCEEENMFEELTWKETTTLSAVPDSLRNFVVGLSEDDLPQEMITGEIEIQFDLDWEGENPVSVATFYIELQEDVNGVKTTYGTENEIELAQVIDFGDDGKFALSLKYEDVYALFSDGFAGSRDQYDLPVLPGDVFEITWKLTGKNGDVADIRNECFGIGCQYGFSAIGESAIFNWWNGTFDYEWTEASDDVIYYGYGDIDIGTTGSIEITPNSNDGESTVNHTMFNYYFGDGEAVGTLTFNEATGAVSLTGDMEEAWLISNVNGSSLDISWTYQWSTEYGKVTLTRRDGRDWPTNIYSSLGEAPEDDVWNGTFNYEYLEVGPGVSNYTYDASIFEGATGTVDCVTAGGVPSVSHGCFYYWYDDPWEITLSYDYASGLVAVATTPNADMTWVISNVTERTIDIEYNFNSIYDEYATVRLTRTGNYEWPANLHTE